MLTTDELRYLLDDSGARVLFTAAALANSWQPLVGDLLEARRVVVCEGEKVVDDRLTLAELAFHPRPDPSRPARWIAMIRLPSCTPRARQGKQKGATLSHGNLVSNTLSAAHLQGITPDDRLILVSAPVPRLWPERNHE